MISGEKAIDLLKEMETEIALGELTHPTQLDIHAPDCYHKGTPMRYLDIEWDSSHGSVKGIGDLMYGLFNRLEVGHRLRFILPITKGRWLRVKGEFNAFSIGTEDWGEGSPNKELYTLGMKRTEIEEVTTDAFYPSGQFWIEPDA